jgi:4'-phosphopantetheinyl transferase
MDSDLTGFQEGGSLLTPAVSAFGPSGRAGLSSVHVWSVPLKREGVRIQPDMLSAEERAIAERFVRQSKRRAYALSRMSLRVILGRYLGIDPADVQLERGRCSQCGGRHGKPYVSGAIGRLDFSLSRSDDIALIAVGLGIAVGIDVESRRHLPVDDLAEALSDEEWSWVSARPGERSSRFLHLWTRKEAYLKGVGLGLTVPLSAIGTLPPSTTTDSDVEALGPFSLDGMATDAVDVPGPHIAAMATELRVSRVIVHRRFEW